MCHADFVLQQLTLFFKDDEEEDDDDEDENDEFHDEPRKDSLYDEPEAYVVEDYGLDQVPHDEDLELGEGGADSVERSERKKRLFFILVGCFCCAVLAGVGVILGVLVFKDDDKESTAALAPTGPPTVRPTLSPTVPSPIDEPLPTIAPTTKTPTSAPSVSTNELEISITASADTYVIVGGEGGDEEGPFGDENSLLVQGALGDTQKAAVSLLTFPTMDIPNPTTDSDGTTTSTVSSVMLVLTLFEPADGAIVIETERYPNEESEVEGFTSNIFAESQGIVGPEFTIEEGAEGNSEVRVDITELALNESTIELRHVRRVQQGNEPFLFLVLKTTAVNDESYSIRFYSSESDFPPRLDVELEDMTDNNSTSPAPSTSAGETVSPTMLPTPFVDGDTNSTSAPSTSPDSSEGNTTECMLCGAGNELTNPDTEIVLFDLLMSYLGLDLAIVMDGPITCATLQNELANNNIAMGISDGDCTMLVESQQLQSFCCMDEFLTNETSTAPDWFVCDICSDGSNVTYPDMTVTLPETLPIEDYTCDGYQIAATMGLIPESLCSSLQEFTDEHCCDIDI